MTNNRITWIGPDDPPNCFPPVDTALREPDGLLAAGGDLAPERLLWAYRHGIFPWYDEGQPLLWWSPNPRCLFARGDFHASRRLLRWMRSSSIEVRTNSAFGEVIRACAGPRRYEQGTWITPDMIAAYETLHDQGWAHSIEIWDGDELCGGLYGLIIGKAFFGESMYSARENASKVALMFLDSLLDSGDFELIDCQVISQHLMSLGARILPRNEFVTALESACASLRRYENWPSAPITARQLAQS